MAHWPNRFVVSQLPKDHPWIQHFRLLVEYWKNDLWVIHEGFSHSSRMDADGEWGHPWDFKDRPGEFEERFSFSLERALEIAEKLSAEMRGYNGMTAQDVLAKGEVDG